MELKVYAGEYFHRNKWRYIWFGIIIILVLAISIYYLEKQFFRLNIASLIVLTLIFAGYIFFFKEHLKEITLNTTENSLQIGGKEYSRLNFVGYILEMNIHSKEIKNIVFIFHKGHNIYTIKDKNDNLKKFISHLSKYIPILDEYDQTFFEKLTRKLKL